MGKHLPQKVFQRRVAEELHPIKNGSLRPEDITPGSHQVVWWRGRCGHEWQQRIDQRRAGCGCPYCAGTKVLEGYNDLASRCPDVAESWHPTKNGNLTPRDVTYGSIRKVWWLGKCGHEWEARVNSRVRAYGCPICRRIERERRSKQRKVLSDSYAPVGATLMDTSTSLFQWACQQRHLRGVSFDSIAEQLGISRDMAERLCCQDSSEDEVLGNLSKRDAMVGDAYVA